MADMVSPGKPRLPSVPENGRANSPLALGPQRVVEGSPVTEPRTQQRSLTKGDGRWILKIHRRSRVPPPRCMPGSRTTPRPRAMTKPTIWARRFARRHGGGQSLAGKEGGEGYARIAWPKEAGGLGGTRDSASDYNQEEAKIRRARHAYVCHRSGHVHSDADGLCLEGVGARYVAPALAGEEIWCQLFSETGRRLGRRGLRTRAEKHGADWIVSARRSGLRARISLTTDCLLARTDFRCAQSIRV